MAVTVVILAINLRHWTSAGLLGVAMNNLLSFNLSLSAVLSGWTTLETSLGAIARSKDFEAETEVEDKLYEVIKPTKDWPTQGLLEIESISAEYKALLQKRKLVLMDEATSSIDVETARKITDMVETEFQGSTILTVAHRKETILGAEVVVVMEQGEVVEMGDPRVLMGKEGSRLSALLQDEGSKDL
ncbi:hypothetical protein ACEPPN_006700 [Leptodophora sp. 'Broadleaf-Isolate-01']